MGMWTIMEEGRDGYGRDFGMRSGETETAYRQGYEEGCRHGYKKAMMEAREDMAFRDNYGGGSQGMRGGSYGGGSYGNRMPGYLPEDPWPDDMGERRRRRANGQFY